MFSWIMEGYHMHKKAFITAGVLLGAYILDIWLIAPLAALIAASNTWASHGM